MDIVIIGAGSMAIAYAKVLDHLGFSYSCMGRGSASADRFFESTGVRPGTGSLDEQLSNKDMSDSIVIVAVDIMQLYPVCETLLKTNCVRVLVEKPGAVDIAHMMELTKQDPQDRIKIAYNRRFLPSVQRAVDIISSDGGVQTLHFEFTELPDRVEKLGVHPPEVLRNFAFANSSHVFDLAFYLCNANRNLDDVEVAASLQQGELAWHEEGSRVVSCGQVKSDILYTCSADWRSGGGWAIEITTQLRRLRFRPLESLTEQLRETFSIEDVQLETEPEELKPGLLGLVVDFIENEGKKLPTMAEQTSRMKVFTKILGKST